MFRLHQRGTDSYLMGKATQSPRARLLANLEPRGYGTLSSLQAQSAAARHALDELVAEGLVQRRGTAVFLADASAVADRLEERLRATPKLFKKSGLKEGTRGHPKLDAILEDLWAARRILRFELKGDAKLGFLYLHPQHAGRLVPPAPAAPSATDLESSVLAAHRRLQERGGHASVRLAALVAESGRPLAEVQAWIRRRVLGDGWGALESGNWPDATAEERAAAIEHLGIPRLYVRLTPPAGT